MALFPSLFARGADPRDCDLANCKATPSADHWFGYDQQGCDYLANVVYGARNSLIIGLLAVLVILVLGVHRRRHRRLLRRLTDGILSRLHRHLLRHAVDPRRDRAPADRPSSSAGCGRGGDRTGRVRLDDRDATGPLAGHRGEEFGLRRRGPGDGGVQQPHPASGTSCPNAVAPVLVYATITIGVLIAAEATLTFLGVGLQRPAISWGLQIEQRAVTAADGAAPGAVPEPDPDPDRDGLHHAGRRPARRPGPEAALMTRPDISSYPESTGRAGCPGARRRRSARRVPHPAQPRERRQRRQLHTGGGGDPRDPGGVRVRQVRLRPGDHGHPRLAAGRHHRGRHPLRGP